MFASLYSIKTRWWVTRNLFTSIDEFDLLFHQFSFRDHENMRAAILELWLHSRSFSAGRSYFPATCTAILQRGGVTRAIYSPPVSQRRCVASCRLPRVTAPLVSRLKLVRSLEFPCASNKWATSDYWNGNHDSAFNFQLLVLVMECEKSCSIFFTLLFFPTN